jgi:transposase
MGPRTQISCEKGAQAIILHKQGYSNRQIAKIVQISEKGVRTAIKRFSETGVNTDRQRSGRPKVTSKQEDKFIIVTSNRLRTLTA